MILHIAILAATLWSVVGPVGPAEAQIVPHRAAYTISLAGTREGSDITAARGVHRLFLLQLRCYRALRRRSHMRP